MSGTREFDSTDARGGLSLEPPADLFDGDDVDTGETAPTGDDLTEDEVMAISGEASRRGTPASDDEAN